MRDHRKLRAFELADNLVLEIYIITKSFPREEQYGLTSQMRRAAVSVPSNIVEGCTRITTKEYVRFLEVSLGSLKELEYQLSLSFRLEYLISSDYQKIQSSCQETGKVLYGLISSLRK